MSLSYILARLWLPHDCLLGELEHYGISGPILNWINVFLKTREQQVQVSGHQGWGEYWTYEYEYWEISTRVVHEYNVFSIFMFIILGKTSTRVVLAPALVGILEPYVCGLGGVPGYSIWPPALPSAYN